MAFLIEQISLTEFMREQKIKLPRFQRKASWDEKQNFQLCISVFKGYPVGVVIYNSYKSTKWLLDGRQRRNALKTAWENPVNVYHYAQKFLGFKNSSTHDDIRKLFWSKVDSFLQKDISLGDNADSESDIENEIEDYSNSIDLEEQKGNLQTLLNLILMVHPIKKNVSAWEKRFDFSNYVLGLRYVDDGIIDQKKLKTTLLEWDEDNPNGTFERFSELLLRRLPLKNGISSGKFKDHLEHDFETLRNDIRTVREAEGIFSEAKIGIITLSNVTALDAQNIFSLVNTGGTKLKAEELLSAKPFWNEYVPNQFLDKDVRTSVYNLYKDLNIPSEDAVNTSDVVRWDICATLLDRIDKNNLFFPSFEQKKNNINMTKISLGFKLVAADQSKGISSKDIEKMEQCQEDWEDKVQSLIQDINRIAEILLDVNFYHNLIGWNKSVYELTSSAATLEFITLLRKNWIELGKPTVDSGKRNMFIHNSLVLFDKLLYEYSHNQWRGSGDSKMAHDIDSIPERLTEISKESWSTFISEVCKSNTNYKMLEPILYYFAVLQKKQPDSISQNSYDVDHIVPQNLFDSQRNQELSTLKDTLGNLAILPYKSNRKKKDKRLKEIEDELKDEVSRYADIKRNDFDKYSDITNLPELCKQRQKIFLDIVKNKRTSLFANNKLI